MQPINWNALMAKYADPRLSADVRQDIGQLIAYAKIQVGENDKLHGALQGARETLLALCCAVGLVEIPYALLEKAKDGRLLVSDVKTNFGMVKRFEWSPTVVPFDRRLDKKV